MHPQDAKRRADGMSVNESLGLGEESQFEENLLELAPFLRSFGQALSRNREMAQDLVQETLLSAWRTRSTFTPGTNLKALLCTILRNKFYSHCRRTRSKVQWEKEVANDNSERRPEQGYVLDLSDTLRALRCLPDEQREALILVGAGGSRTRMPRRFVIVLLAR